MKGSLSRPFIPLKPSTTLPLLHRLYSSTTSAPPPPEDEGTVNQDDRQQQVQKPPSSSLNSYFNDVKSSLKQKNPNPQTQQNLPNLPPLRHPGSFSPNLLKPTSQVTSLEEIRKNLSEFRRRSAVPPPTDLNPSQHNRISFQDIYNRNVKSGDSVGGNESRPSSGKLSFEAIRESLRQMRSRNNSNAAAMETKIGNVVSLSGFRESLRLKPADGNTMEKTSTVIGGTEGLPVVVFGKEMKEEEINAGKVGDAMSTEFVKMYSYGELGEKLRSLRPEAKGKDKKPKERSLLHDLNERLRKLRELEQKQTESRIGGVSFRDLRESLVKLSLSGEEKAKKGSSKYFTKKLFLIRS